MALANKRFILQKGYGCGNEERKVSYETFTDEVMSTHEKLAVNRLCGFLFSE